MEKNMLVMLKYPPQEADGIKPIFNLEVLS